MQLENKFTIEAPIEKAWEALNTPETVAPCFPGATLTEYEGDTFTGSVKVKLGPISLTYKGKGTYKERDDAAHRVVIDASGRDSRGNGTANATVTGSMVADGPDKTEVTMVTDMTITGRPAQFGRGVISDVADKIIGQFASCVAEKLSPEPQASSADTPSPSTGAGSTPASSPPATSTPATSPPATSTPATSAPATSAPATSTPASSTESSSAEAAGGSTNGAANTGAGATTATATAAGPTLSSTPSSSGVSEPKPVAAPSGPMRSEIDAIDLLDTAGAPVIKRLAPVIGGVLVLLIVLLVRRSRAR